MAKRKVKRARRKKGSVKKLPTYKYKRLGFAVEDEANVVIANLTDEATASNWVNPAYEIKNAAISENIAVWKYIQEHRLNQIIGLNDFIEFSGDDTTRQLYGMYRILGISLSFIPNVNNLDAQAGSNLPSQMVIQQVKDPANLINDQTTEGQVKQFQNMTSKKLIFSEGKKTSYYFKPHVQVELPSSDGTALGIFKRSSSPWLRLDKQGVAVNHYGEKLFLKSNEVFSSQAKNNFRVEKTFYIEFKQVM